MCHSLLAYQEETGATRTPPVWHLTQTKLTVCVWIFVISIIHQRVLSKPQCSFAPSLLRWHTPELILVTGWFLDRIIKQQHRQISMKTQSFEQHLTLFIVYNSITMSTFLSSVTSFNQHLQSDYTHVWVCSSQFDIHSWKTWKLERSTVRCCAVTYLRRNMQKGEFGEGGGWQIEDSRWETLLEEWQTKHTTTAKGAWPLASMTGPSPNSVLR